MVIADCAHALLIGSVPVAALPVLVGRGRLTAATSALYGPATVVGIIAPGVAALLFKVPSVPSVLASTR
jgi:hypothetical protein